MPRTEIEQELLERFVSATLTGLLSNPTYDTRTPEEIIVRAFEFARLAMRERLRR
jgi:hypothetical protein